MPKSSLILIGLRCLKKFIDLAQSSLHLAGKSWREGSMGRKLFSGSYSAKRKGPILLTSQPTSSQYSVPNLPNTPSM